MEVTSHVDDYHGSFRDTVWLTSFPLNAQTVLHYFALSPFYDRSCNNERLKMQRLGLDQLKSMRGIEYELLPNVAKQLPQQLFLIRKQRRAGRTQVKPLAMYYVLDGTVYQAPNIHAMLTSRLKKCSYRINKAFHGLAAGVRFSPTEGYAWDFSSADKKEPVIPSERTSCFGADFIGYLHFAGSNASMTHMFVWAGANNHTELQLKLKQKYEKMEKQRENSARVDSILIRLMKKHAPEIAAKIDVKDEASAAAAQQAQAEAQAKAAAAAAANGNFTGTGIKRENDDSAGQDAVKRQKVA
ncbi:TPA: hypothetical protein N0F65_004752 [Lagenidium giganteum]|uniref:Mediator of RNA polymerase II transcription subunit 6 n=1 Tax=Lagenidium giganteum TaxID=4803 RepID=A0AAV2YUS1_9STRA|nr:TPA: hypothetical protein N0F65_004752 [Lagenidium giganteum]